MGRFRVCVRSDGLAAEIQATAGPPVTSAELHAELAAARVVHGIDAAAIEALLARFADANYKGSQVVALGIEAVHGIDGSLSFQFATTPVAGTTHEDGTIDYRERALLHPAAAGQPIARIVQPTAGTPGRSVRGEPIANKPGRPFMQRLGPGAQAEGEFIVANRGGVVLDTGRQLDVVALCTHQANVDLASGNLHSNGSLLVRGDVCEGSTAQADGDVQITGAVLDACVTAGGSVRVDQGILGASSEVHAAEDICCRHATSAQLHAGRTIELGDVATHCRMQADQIRILGGRGVAFGGDLSARQSIDLRVAGTPNGATTHLSICDPGDDLSELARRQADAARLARPQHGGTGQPPRLPAAKVTRMVTRADDHSQAERLRVLQRQREMLRTAAIRITDTVHPGVVIRFGQVTMPITEQLATSNFTFDTERDVIVRGGPP